MDITSFISELEAAIEGLGPGSLAPDTRFRDLPAWDSLAALSTLSVVDAVFGVQISGEQLRQCHTVQEIFDLGSRLKRS